MLSFMGHRAATRALQTHSVHISWRCEAGSTLHLPTSFKEIIAIHSQHDGTDENIALCIPSCNICFPLQCFMFVCHFLLTQQVLPAAGCCQQWGLLPTAGEWPRHSSAATPSSFPFLQHLPIGSAPKARFDPCTFFSSAVASHVLSCSPSSSQQQKGLVSPPHSWRLPTAGSGFLSNLSPAELGLLALSAVGQMKR